MAETKLLPCAHCDGAPVILTHVEREEEARIMCGVATCGSGITWWRPRPEAIAAWNRRSLPPVGSGEVEEMAQQLAELIETAERDMKLNKDEDNGGYWSLRTSNCFAPAREALAAYRALSPSLLVGDATSE